MEEHRDTFWKLFRSGGSRMTSGMLDAFLDGFTGSGERVRLPCPPTTHRQTVTALTCGFVSLGNGDGRLWLPDRSSLSEDGLRSDQYSGRGDDHPDSSDSRHRDAQDPSWR